MSLSKEHQETARKSLARKQELDMRRDIAIMAVFTLLYIATVYEASSSGNFQLLAAWHVIAPLIYLGGRWADKATTIVAISRNKELQSNGSSHRLIETHDSFPPEPTAKDLFSPKEIVIDLVGTVVPSALVPPAGIKLGVGSFLVAYNNHKHKLNVRQV